MKLTFQEIIRRFNDYWQKQGCIIHQGYDLEMGAGTFNPATFLRSLGPEPYFAAYVEPSRRPTDGRYGENPNRVQLHHQYQILLKPSPDNLQEIYLDSLRAIGFDLGQHDIRFVHDDWEAPTLGAWGLGWEVWMDGMEVTQFTYFQNVGGQVLKPVSGELTVGLERLAMYLLEVDNIFDLPWNEHLTYGDIFKRNEVEFSRYNFDEASTDMWFRHFDDFELEAKRLAKDNLPLPAYDFVMKASHAFNVLDARGVISVSERTGYIARIRDLACMLAESFVAMRKEEGYPLMGLSTPFPVRQVDRSDLPKLDTRFNPKDRQDFLLEIGSEELPASFVPIGCQNLQADMEKLLSKEGLDYGDVEVFGTPRRLAIKVSGLVMGRAASEVERRGPAVDRAFNDDGTGNRAAEGFFRSLGVEVPTREAVEKGECPGVEVREVKGQRYLFAMVKHEGRSTMEILAETLPELIVGLDFPKKMRWGDLDISYARPLRWIVALLGEKVVPFIVGNIMSGKESSGHRQIQPGNFAISRPGEYLETLRNHKVMVDLKEREANIRQQLAEEEEQVGGHAVEVDRVLPQVLNLVEWPLLTSASFGAEFLKAPKEVLISEMVEHQKYFPVANKDGSLMNTFIITADTTPTDRIRHGNQMVLSARLSDGLFLYHKDLDHRLEDYNEKLHSMTFMKGLGSMYNKVERLTHHASLLTQQLSLKVDLAIVQRAALLCKADLASEMVYEFPELQGVMGKIYAEKQGESADVAIAIDEHWMPRGEKAPLPKTPVGIVLSLADKLDNLIACFGTGVKPSSSSDPYALRRQVLGIIKMVIREKIHLDLPDVLKKAHAHFGAGLLQPCDQVVAEIWDFITNRIRTVFQDFGFRKDEIIASLSRECHDIFDTYLKVEALHRFRESGDRFGSLLEVYKRARGQIGKEEEQPFDEKLLKETAEKELHRALVEMEKALVKVMERRDYDSAYALIADMQPYIARLFDEVKILADDQMLQRNRIALLQRVFSGFSKLLDFSKIQEDNRQNTKAKPAKV